MNWIKEEWTKKDYQEYLEYLKKIKEEDYAQFQKKLINTKYEILGIRTPIQRKIAKEIAKGNVSSFFKFCNSFYYEEVNIEGLVLSSLKEKESFDFYFQKFLSKIDNWAICDQFCTSIEILKREKENYFPKIKKLLKRKEEFSLRVGIVCLLNYYVEEKYINEIFSLMNQIHSEKYYVNMAMAWLLAECYIKYPKKTLPFLKDNELSSFVQKKTIQKICDSYRVSKETKEKLKKDQNGLFLK